MSEVSRRDTAKKLMAKVAASIKKLHNQSISAVELQKKFLHEKWISFETYHEQVLARAGAVELEEQEEEYDEGYDLYQRTATELEDLIASKQAVIKFQENLQENKRKFKMFYDIFGQAKTLFDDDNMALDESLLNTHRDRLEQYYNQCQQLITSRIASGEDEIEVMADQHSIYAMYTTTAALIRSKLSMFVEQNNATVNNSVGPSAATNAVNDIKVARLSIKKFNGDAECWESFRDNYTHSFHLRANMPNVVKFQHLKSLLEGEAEELIRNIVLTDGNYQAAWKLLTDRYQNQKFLIHTHMKNLFNQTVCKEYADDLRKLLTKTTSTLQALKNLNCPVEHWDDWIVYLVVERIDAETRKLWEQSQSQNDENFKWEDLDQFLQARVRSLESIGQCKPLNNRTKLNIVQRANVSVKSHQASSTVPVSSKSKRSCADCNRNHPIRYCHTFQRRNPEERRSIIIREKLCFNCLGYNHLAESCPSNQRCRQCNEPHHSLLHIPTNNSVTVSTMHARDSIKVINNPHNQTILLATAYVNVTSGDGKIIKLRALLDSGSQASFISQAAVKLLRLPKRRVNVDVTGVGSVFGGTVTSSVSLHFSSCVNEFNATINALVLPIISKPLQNLTININTQCHIHGLKLADPSFSQPNEIDLLLGADIYGQLMLDGIRRGSYHKPTAQNTVLGWVLLGPINQYEPINNICSKQWNVFSCTVEQQLQKFWELEEVAAERFLTSDEHACEDHFVRTHTRDVDGRFIVRLPFINDHVELGNSYNSAVHRQHQLERRFAQNVNLQKQYCDFMDQYFSLNHMELVEDSATSANVCYIPHHAIFKENSTSTKLRVVYDASHKTTNNKCLNEQMHSGPKLQQELTAIITRWRKHAVVFAADIEKMFRQIKVDKRDQDLQRIVWRSSTTERMQSYRLTTVTYGTTAAPYLAIRSLRQLALNESKRFPIGSHIALNDTYVDDVLSGSHDVPSALEAQSQIRCLFQSGGFTLKKWASNCEALLTHLPQNYIECSLPLNFDADENLKMLGIQWNPATDDFSYNFPAMSTIMPPNKRCILSDVAKLYDPLGWLAPSVLIAKTFFQKLWTLGLGWDDPLPTDLANRWLEYRESLLHLKPIKIPRWLKCSSNGVIYELHGYCDASNIAYAAVVYLRIVNSNGHIDVTLLASKTKVAPLKTITIPRLELCGAVLLAKLINNIKKIIDIADVTTYAWTDSTVVLCWIRSLPSRWSIFVANRVTEIQSRLSPECWNHVVSEMNPADCASRGVMPNVLKDHDLWWNGPKWLHCPAATWAAVPTIVETDDELRKKVISVNQSNHIYQLQLINDVSDWQRLLRITAYCLRFCSNLRKAAANRFFGCLLTSELLAARTLWVKLIQMQNYSNELATLNAGATIGKKSSIIALNPIIDSDGILRVGGRLGNSSIPYDQRHPIIIPKKSKMSTLIIKHAHHSTLHGGTQLTLSYIRRIFWLTDGRNETRRFIQSCTRCIRYRARPLAQKMADLPACRITPSRPFMHTGVDFSGAIMVRSSRGRGHHASKAYICVFVCMVTRAIHIELVSALSSAAFIAAYKRFTARRGICSDLYSDNGTNFVGAEAELRKAFKEAKTASHISSELANIGTTWHFSPPLSPHFNGISESGIRSIKHHLRRIVGESTLTFEEMCTFLAQVEACLNSRPLYPLTNDPNDVIALTPGHFLIGEAPTTVPEPNFLQIPVNRLSRWQLLQQKLQSFWKRWSVEYLHHLQQRQKWRTSERNLKVGDLVIIKDDNVPPGKWALGRVTEVHPGADDKVRVASVRQHNTISKRPIVKLILLPHPDEHENTP